MFVLPTMLVLLQVPLQESLFPEQEEQVLFCRVAVLVEVCADKQFKHLLFLFVFLTEFINSGMSLNSRQIRVSMS